jgi:hypothetical protein
MKIAERLREIKDLAERADRLVCDLASGRKKWNMCVPPQDDDTDMVLIELPRTTVPALVSALERAVEALEWIRKDIAFDNREDVIVRKTDEALTDISKLLEVSDA